MAEVSRYVLDDNAANNIVVDSVGSNTGTSVGDTTDNLSTTGPAGLANTAFALNGTDEYVNIGADSSLDLSAITIAAIINLDATWPDFGNICAKRSAADPSFYFAVDSNRKLALAGGTSTPQLSTEVIPLSTWTWVGMTIVGTAGKLYIGDSAAESKTTTAIASVPLMDVLIGARWNLDGSTILFPFKGSMADIRIYNTALSESEMATLREEMFPSGTEYDRTRGQRNRDRYA